MYHYKEWPPIKTSNHIKDIQKNLGITTTETRWQVYENQNYSLRLNIEGTEIGTNGKGVTKELALASAFGEFMERIQNQYLYPLFLYYQYDTSLQRLNGFFHSPDEILLEIPEFLEKTDRKILKHLIPSNLGNNESPREFLRALSILDPHSQKEELLCIPYYCLSTSSLVYVPRSIISFVYGTNGMCAGNTPEEALVQGLCEIIERYANRKTILEDLTPPDVSIERFSGFNQKLLEPLEKSKKLKLFVKDASLGEQLPAVSIGIINTELSRYFVKFGSHVECAVALERTLTELFQGKTMRELEHGEHMVPFEYSSNQAYKNQENLLEVFASGEGKYNENYFGKSCSYSLNEEFYRAKNLKNNSEYLRYLIRSLIRRGWRILVRDVNFLGFPSFHVIIPGISEIRTLCKEDCIEMQRKIKVARLLMDINACTEDGLHTIAGFVIDQMKKGQDSTLSDLTGLTYQKGFFWERIKLSFFLSTLFLRLGDLQKSHEYMGMYISEIEEKNITLEQGGLKFYKCLRDYLALSMKKEGIKEEKIEILQRIYGSEIVKEAKRTVINLKGALQGYGRFPCPDCSRCSYVQSCIYEKIRTIHKKIKNQLNNRPIDQLEENRVFWSKFV